MNIGQYNSQITEIKKILRNKDILSNFNRDNLFNSKQAKEISKHKDYVKLHTEIYNSSEYTFQLDDNSLFQFSFNADPFILNYCYIPFPFEGQSYKDFLNLSDFSYDEVGESLREIYDQEMSSSNLKSNIMLIRYDYSEKEYNEQIHSVSHIHIGFTDMRISSEKIINPITFFMFVLKQVYIDIWKDIIPSSTFQTCYHRYKDLCEEVNSCFLTSKDKDELCLR